MCIKLRGLGVLPINLVLPNGLQLCLLFVGQLEHVLLEVGPELAIEVEQEDEEGSADVELVVHDQDLLGVQVSADRAQKHVGAWKKMTVRTLFLRLANPAGRKNVEHESFLYIHSNS